MDPDEDLWGDLQAFLLDNGASVVGCGSMLQVPDSKRDGYPTGISIGFALDPSLIEGLLDAPSQAFLDDSKSVRASLVRLRHACVAFLTERGHITSDRVQVQLESVGQVLRQVGPRFLAVCALDVIALAG